jgi:hypothetical protein
MAASIRGMLTPRRNDPERSATFVLFYDCARGLRALGQGPTYVPVAMRR